MKQTLTRQEMLEVWRNLRTGEPMRLDCTVTRTDGTDNEDALAAEMRAWYLDLLDSAPEPMLAPVDTAATATVATGHAGVTTVTATADTRRILRVRFAGWGAPLAPDCGPDLVRRLAANPYCRRPAAARIAPNVVIVCGASGPLAELTCAVDHGTQTYCFDDKALNAILTTTSDSTRP